VLLKRKWVVIFTFLVFVTFSFAFTSIQKPVYMAKATVRIDQYKSVMNVISDLLRWSPGEIMSTEVETAQSAIVLEKAAREIGRIKPGATKVQRYAAVDSLRAQVKAERIERTNMIQIQTTASNPDEAASIANAVAEAYREESKTANAEDVRTARVFVEDQLKKAQIQLRKSEDMLRNFKRLHSTLSVDSETKITLDRLSALESELLQIRNQRQQIRAELSDLSARRRNLDVKKEVNTADSGLAVSMYNKWTGIQEKIDTESKELTEANPDMQNLRREERRTWNRLVDTVKNSMDAKTQELSRQDDALAAREGELSGLVGSELSKIPDKDLDLSRLTREVSVNEELYTLLNREFKQAQIKEMGMVSQVTLVSPAIPPKAPIKPNKRLSMIIGIVLGLILGAVLSTLVESFDTSIGAMEDIERLLNVPVLAAVPRFDYNGRAHLPSFMFKRTPTHAVSDFSKVLPTVFNPSSAEAEAYRHLRTNFQFSRMKDDKKVYLVSSSGSQEGKSITTSNLAVVLAQSGQKTLLMSCNLRRPSVDKIFGIPRKPGITDILIGAVTIEEATHTFADIVMGEMDWEPALKLPGIDNLHILPSGTSPPNPTELLESNQMENLINGLRKKYDIILIDAPPVLPVTDSLLLGSKAEGAILVYQLGHLPRRALIRAKKLMEGVGINIVGIVLNDVRPEFHGVAPVYISHEYMKATKKVMQDPERVPEHDPFMES